MGLPFPARHGADVFFLHAYGKGKRGTNKFFGKLENAEKVCCLILQKTVAMVEYSWVLPKR